MAKVRWTGLHLEQFVSREYNTQESDSDKGKSYLDHRPSVRLECLSLPHTTTAPLHQSQDPRSFGRSALPCWHREHRPRHGPLQSHTAW